MRTCADFEPTKGTGTTLPTDGPERKISPKTAVSHSTISRLSAVKGYCLWFSRRTEQTMLMILITFVVTAIKDHPMMLSGNDLEGSDLVLI